MLKAYKSNGYEIENIVKNGVLIVFKITPSGEFQFSTILHVALNV